MMAVMAAETALSVKIACHTGMFGAPMPPVVVAAWLAVVLVVGGGLAVWASLERKWVALLAAKGL